jgi:hypothetical protein
MASKRIVPGAFLRVGDVKAHDVQSTKSRGIPQGSNSSSAAKREKKIQIASRSVNKHNWKEKKGIGRFLGPAGRQVGV